MKKLLIGIGIGLILLTSVLLAQEVSYWYVKTDLVPTGEIQIPQTIDTSEYIDVSVESVEKDLQILTRIRESLKKMGNPIFTDAEGNKIYYTDSQKLTLLTSIVQDALKLKTIEFKDHLNIVLTDQSQPEIVEFKTPMLR